MSSLGENDFWRGAFIKHQRHEKKKGEGSHIHELPEHLYVKSVETLEEDEIEAYDEDIENEYGYDQLVQLGDGPVSYLVKMAFVGGEDTDTYDFVMWLPENFNLEEDEDKVKRLLAEYYSP